VWFQGTEALFNRDQLARKRLEQLAEHRRTRHNSGYWWPIHWRWVRGAVTSGVGVKGTAPQPVSVSARPVLRERVVPLALTVAETRRAQATPAIAVKAPAADTTAAVAVTAIAQAIKAVGMAIMAVEVTARAPVMPVAAEAAGLGSGNSSRGSGGSAGNTSDGGGMGTVPEATAEAMRTQAEAAAGTGAVIFVVRTSGPARQPASHPRRQHNNGSHARPRQLPGSKPEGTTTMIG
jgi:hypothetical protein